MTDVIKMFTVATIVCSVFVGATYLHAQWSNPPSSPPASNVAPPINISDSVQMKQGQGAIGAYRLFAENQIHSQNNLVADNEVRSDRYCDRNGNNCFSMSDVGSSQYNSCDTWNNGLAGGYDPTIPRNPQHAEVWTTGHLWGHCSPPAGATWCYQNTPSMYQCFDGEVKLIDPGSCYCTGS